MTRWAVVGNDGAQRLLTRGQAGTAALMLVTLSGLPALAAVDAVPPTFRLRNVAATVVAVVTLVYVLIIAYKSVLVVTALRQRQQRPTAIMAADRIPTYSLLVPLYKEAAVLGQLIANLQELDYPSNLLQVLLLIEEDDSEMLASLAARQLPPHFQVVLIPASLPRTKPKACNVGLANATGELCVIYDAEDRPDPGQLKLAAAVFHRAPRATVCLQAELQYFNPDTNVLTHWFAAEYACNFSLMLHGLTRRGAPVPLGGTSNHFRTEVLRKLGGWDEYNVTEDADLGIRMARSGLRVDVIESVTWEEANSQVGNWLRQRSRWIKGYVQTYLVHMRHPGRLLRELGLAGFFSFQCTVGGTPFTLLANPLFWALTVAYIGLGQHWVSVLFPGPVFYLGITSMFLGNFLSLWYLMWACMKRQLYPSIRWVLLVPLYWGLMSAAAAKAVWQLANPRLRHHWEKTTHGLVSEPIRPSESPRAVAVEGRA